MQSKYRISRGIVAIALALFAANLPATDVTGLISTQTWSAAGNYWNLTGDVAIPAGQTLTIDPDVAVVPAASDDQGSGLDPALVELIVEGSLLANGTAATFVLVSPLGPWGGIRVENGANARFGYMYVDGDVSMASGSTFTSAVQDDFYHDELFVTGSVTLNGDLALDLGAFAPFGNGGSWTILSNLSENPINGNFTGLLEGGVFNAGSWDFRISYTGGTGNDVTLFLHCPDGDYAWYGVCGACEAGYYCGDNTQRTQCAAGSYQALTGQTSCDPAPAGGYVSSVGATVYQPCSAGTYQPATGQTFCIDAPAGTYVDTTGANTATPCAAGTYQNLTGQTSCIISPAGSYVAASGATEATPCPVGTLQVLDGQSSCDAASPGYYVAVTGAITQDACLAGTYQPQPGQSSCLTAPAGTYVDSTAATDTISCPAGMTSPAGSTSIDACVDKPPKSGGSMAPSLLLLLAGLLFRGRRRLS